MQPPRLTGDWWELPPLRQVRRVRCLDQPARRPYRPRTGHGRGLWRFRRRTMIGVACTLLLLAYATSGWTSIGPDEAGLLQRFGRYRGSLGPGLHLRWPNPIERVTAVTRDRVRSLDIGFRTTGRSDLEPLRWESTHGRPTRDQGDDRALLLTGDGRYVEVAATLQFSIDPADPEALRRFVFHVANGEAALSPLAESAVREVVGRRPLLDLLTSQRRGGGVGRRGCCSPSARLPIDSASRCAVSRFRISIPPSTSSTPTATFRAPPAIASAGSTRPKPIEIKSWRQRPGGPGRCLTPPKPAARRGWPLRPAAPKPSTCYATHVGTHPH